MSEQDEYTPSVDVVREGHAFFVQAKIAGATFGQGLAEFDRWLAEHDAAVRREAAAEQREKDAQIVLDMEQARVLGDWGTVVRKLDAAAAIREQGTA